MNVGDRFGMLVAIAHAAKRDYRRYWLMRCDCGAEKEVRETHLLGGLIRGCGCDRAQRTREAKTRHGKSHTPVHIAWTCMKQRCLTTTNQAYKNYGGRGIKVCDRWLKFDNFLADMGEPPTGSEIERINNDGDYEPGNCRWATTLEQSRNKRTTRFLTMNGETLPMVVWAERLGLKKGTLHNRLKLGWPVEKALTTPLLR